MKKTATALFSLLLAISALNAQGQTKTYDISGTVVDSLSSEPLPGVYVTAGSKGGQTNGDGHYVIKNVPAGKVTLKTMYYSSYPTATREIELTGDTTVDFILAEQIFNINEVVVTGTRTEKRLAEAPRTDYRDRGTGDRESRFGFHARIPAGQHSRHRHIAQCHGQ